MIVQMAEKYAKSALGQEAEALLQPCVQCGQCTPVCPTFRLLNDEWDGPRGRIFLIKQFLEGREPTLDLPRDLGLSHLTLYSFSTENWRRPAGEIRDLMGLLRQFIMDDLPTLKREGVKVRIIGDRINLDREMKLLVGRAEKETVDNAKFFLQIAFNYGGRDEILRAVRSLAKAAKSGGVDPADIDEAVFAKFLDTAEIPDPDLVIRTSGEKRISNFLLWQAAYAEYVFLDVLWPDFDASHFAGALEEFRKRERRFGGVAVE